MNETLNALKKHGINAKKEDDCTIIGTTASGKSFLMREACTANMRYTLKVEGNTLATRCCYRTALKLLRTI